MVINKRAGKINKFVEVHFVRTVLVEVFFVWIVLLKYFLLE